MDLKRVAEIDQSSHNERRGKSLNDVTVHMFADIGKRQIVYRGGAVNMRSVLQKLIRSVSMRGTEKVCMTSSSILATTRLRATVYMGGAVYLKCVAEIDQSSHNEREGKS